MKKNIDKEKSVFAQIKYEGKLVENGYLDARKSGEVLIGIDEVLRYFLYQENIDFQKIEFEIPIKVNKGSWVADFLANYDEYLLKSAITFAGTKYVGNALSEMAKNDFKNIGFNNLFKTAFKGMTWVLKIAKHLGTLSKRKFDKIKFIKENKFVVIENENGLFLEVPVEYLQLYSDCPSSLFKNLANVVESERELIVTYNDLESKETNCVNINNDSKNIFIPKEEDEETLFPELIHDMYVQIEGHVTRGNEKSNTIGLSYENHIITCYPNKGNIKDFKHTLFTNCSIKGIVDRLNKKTGEFIEKRPRIKVLEITSINPKDKQQKLF
tara:strand:- start:51 stop:1028 length:978 start_codon:yes stop_codon:yes gene_type:complete